VSTINLLPKDYLVRRNQRRANMMCAGLFGIVITGVLTAGLISEHHTRRTLEVRGRVNAVYAKAMGLISQMHQLEWKKKALLKKAENVASLVEHVPRSYLLAITTNALPHRAALVSFGLDTRQVTANGASSSKTGAGKKRKKPGKRQKAGMKTKRKTQSVVVLEITGLARTDMEVSRFMSNLEANGLIDWVDLDYIELRVIDDEAARQFKVRAQLKRGVDVVDVLPPAQRNQPQAPSRRNGSALGGAS